jgi:hypothetical protein
MNTSTVTNNNAETTAIESLFAKKLLRSKGIAVIPPSTGSGKTREIARFASDPKKYIHNVKNNFSNGLCEIDESKKIKTIYISPQIKHCQDFISDIANDKDCKDFCYEKRACRILRASEVSKKVIEAYKNTKKNVNKGNEEFPQSLNKSLLYKNGKTDENGENKQIEQFIETLKTLERLDRDSNISKQIKTELQNKVDTQFRDVKTMIAENYLNLEENPIFEKVELETYLKEPDLNWFVLLFPAHFWDEINTYSLTVKMSTFSIRDVIFSKDLSSLLKPEEEQSFVFIDEADTASEELIDNESENATKNSSRDVIKLLITLSRILDFKDVFPNYSSQKEKKQFEKAIERGRKKFIEHFGDVESNSTLIPTKEVKELANSKVLHNYILRDSVETRVIIKQGENTKKYMKDYYLSFPKNSEESKETPAFLITKEQIEEFPSDEYKVFEYKSFLKIASGLLNYFCEFVYPAIVELIKKNEEDDNEMRSSNGTLQTFKELYNVDEDFIKLLHDYKTQNYKKKITGASSGLLSYCDIGYEIFRVKVPLGGRPAELSRLLVQGTPEQTVVELAENSRVVLVSATANVPSLKNFNLDFLSNRFGDYFDNFTMEDKKDFEAKLNYSNHNKSIELISDVSYELKYYEKDKEPDDTEETWLERKVEENFSYLSKKMKMYLTNELTKEGIHRANYYILLIKYYLAMKAAKTKANLMIFQPNLEKEVIETLLNIFDPKLNEENAIFCANTEKLKTDGFIEKVENAYLEGKTIFLITSLATMGKAVNFTFKAREDEKLIHITPNGWIDDATKPAKRTFDGIAIGDINFSFASKDNNESSNNESSALRLLIDKITEVERLYATNLISNQIKRRIIQEMIINYESLYSFRGEFSTIRKLQGFYVYKEISQAIGRLYRTPNFSEKMLVLTTKNNHDNLSTIKDSIERKSFIETPLMTALMNEVQKEEITKKNSIEAKTMPLKNSGELFSRLLGTLLSDALKFKDKTSIQILEEMRRICIKYGVFLTEETYNSITSEQKDVDITSIKERLYQKVETSDFIKNGYKYKSHDDYSIIDFIDPKSSSEQGIPVSPTNCTIQQFRNLEGFYDYKENCGYTYDKVFNGEYIYILNPTAYNNLFKGALGEFVGKYIFEILFKLPLSRITDPEAYERADFFFAHDNSTAIDFKCYSNPKVEKESLLEGIKNKAKALDIKEYHVINVFPYSTKGVPFTKETLLNEDGTALLNSNGEPVVVKIVQATARPTSNCIVTDEFHQYILDTFLNKKGN